jgi:hypothetical protein
MRAGQQHSEKMQALAEQEEEVLETVDDADKKAAGAAISCLAGAGAGSSGSLLVVGDEAGVVVIFDLSGLLRRLKLPSVAAGQRSATASGGVYG